VFISGSGFSTKCPISDSPQCRGKKDEHGKYGHAHFWAHEDYENFSRAFLRSETLVQAFLKPEYGGKPEFYFQPQHRPISLPEEEESKQ